MGDIVDLLDYWTDNPPEHLILRAVHANPNAKRGRRSTVQRTAPLSEEEARHQLGSAFNLAPTAFGKPQRMPDHIRAMVEAAEEMTAKMKPV